MIAALAEGKAKADLAQSFADIEAHGSASIKAVLPALVPELTYDDLNIREGSSASRLWKEVTLTNPQVSDREQTYADLVAYCTLDTWAMVAIHGRLQTI